MFPQKSGKGASKSSNGCSKPANVTAAKLDEVTRILSDLKSDLDTPKLSSQRASFQTPLPRRTEANLPVERKQQLEQLKVHGRDPTNSDPIFTQDV
jgi:hypothetical protein